MRFLFIKILGMLAVLFLLCLPFFPDKFRFSLASAGYNKKDRWRNILFVLETVILGSLVLCVAPFLKKFLQWLFNLSYLQWVMALIPERFNYAINVVIILVSNVAVCLLFFAVKKFFRNFLDKKVFKQEQTSGSNMGSKKKDKKAKKRQSASSQKDRSDKRIKQLRRDSVLVFDRSQKEQEDKSVTFSDYKTEKNTVAQEDSNKKKEGSDETPLSFGEFIKMLCKKFVGLFYFEKENYEYVKPGAYRWAKELKIFVALVSVVYLVVCLLMQIPIYFSLDKLSVFYSVASWLVNNTYMYPMLSLVLLYELLWFLDGEHKQPEEAEEILVTFTSDKLEENKPDFAKAKASILDKYSLNYNIKNFDSSVLGGKSAYNLAEKDIAVQNIAKAIRANKGFVNGDYMQSIEYMLEGKHVLFDSSLYSALGEYVIHYLFVTLSFGKRVLFICKDKNEIENAASYLDSSFKQITKIPRILWRISTFEKLHEGENPDILLLTPEQFLEENLFTDGQDFFDALTDVFVLDADKILAANNYYCLIMAKKLARAISRYIKEPAIGLSSEAGKKIRYNFFSNGHIQALGNSLRQFFNLEDAPLEAFHSFGLAAKTEIFVWHTGMSSTLYVDNGANQVALEVQIAKDASNFGIRGINLISDTAVYSSQINEIQGLALNSCDLSNRPVGYVIVADDCFNLPNAIYSYSRFSGRKSSVLHVVSKPYLLRDYFTAKAEDYVAHFELIGKTMSEHADSSRANIIILLCDAVNGIERSEFIRRASEIFNKSNLAEDSVCACEDEPDLEECVRMCYKVAFNTDSDCGPGYSIKREQNSELEIKTFVYIKDSERLFEKLLESTRTVRLEYVNSQSVENLSVFKDEIAQHFIPGQVLVRNNHSYTIKDMSVEKGVLILDDTGSSINVPNDYIQTRLYTINNAVSVNSFGHDYRAKNSIVNRIGLNVYDAEISVDTVGYYSIEEAVQTVDLVKPNFAKYVNIRDNDALSRKIKRNIKTKMLVVEMDMNEESDPRASYLLSVVLQEFMKTVFPHQYRCISVCPLFDEIDEDKFFEEELAVRDLYPRIVGSFDNGETEKISEEAVKKGRIRFAVIEDIQGGNGVVETLVDGNGIMVTNLLHVVADYLAWLKSSEGQSSKYLNFGYEQKPAVFDADKLELIIRQFRHDVERSELIRIHEKDSCFFCHCPIDFEKDDKLEDGRYICQSCRESSVNTFEGLDKCLAEVLASVKENTAVADTFPVGISVDFVSTAELRKRFGDREAVLPTGYCNHVTNSIYVEYGLPKASVYRVISRMVTELWQDYNIINDGSGLFEAHLDFVELQVLYSLKMITEADVLNKRYESNEKLSELKKILDETDSQDSFAYFIGVSGKKRNGESEIISTEEDISFVAERDPSSLPRFYYNNLSEADRAVYDQICSAINNYAASTGALTVEISDEKCREILNTVIMDNPDIFWCANPPAAISVDSNGMAKNIIFKYSMSKSEVKRRKKKIEKAVKPFIKGIKESMSDYEVALRAHENIVNLIDYDSIGLDSQERDPDRHNKPDNLRSVYGVFVEEKAVCAGYAKAYQYLLNRLGIECSYVRGQCKDGEWHAWNLIKLEGDYYYVDVTFDDHSNTDERKNTNAEISYDYFAITTEELLKSRNISKAEVYPECTAVKCNYFVRSNLLFNDYDARLMTKIITSAIKTGKKEIAVKAKNENILSIIKSRLITNNGIYDILSSEGVNRQISYYCNDELNILHIIIND